MGPVRKVCGMAKGEMRSRCEEVSEKQRPTARIHETAVEIMHVDDGVCTRPARHRVSRSLNVLKPATPLLLPVPSTALRIVAYPPTPLRRVLTCSSCNRCSFWRLRRRAISSRFCSRSASVSSSLGLVAKPSGVS